MRSKSGPLVVLLAINHNITPDRRQITSSKQTPTPRLSTTRRAMSTPIPLHCTPPHCHRAERRANWLQQRNMTPADDAWSPSYTHHPITLRLIETRHLDLCMTVVENCTIQSKLMVSVLYGPQTAWPPLQVVQRCVLLTLGREKYFLGRSSATESVPSVCRTSPSSLSLPVETSWYTFPYRSVTCAVVSVACSKDSSFNRSFSSCALPSQSSSSLWQAAMISPWSDHGRDNVQILNYRKKVYLSSKLPPLCPRRSGS